jgi:AcrR family transcriptional regulator
MEKLDRRIVRTRGLLRAALLALIAERGYDALRVEDITERANLRRATFYLHYKDKDDLLFAILTETFDALAQEQQHAPDALLGGKAAIDAFLMLFVHAEQYAQLYTTLLQSTAGAAVGRRIREYLAGVILPTLTAEGAAPLRLPASILAQYMAGVEFSLVVWWLEQGRPYPAAQMALYAQRLALGGVLAAYPDGVSDLGAGRALQHAQIEISQALARTAQALDGE